MGQVEPELYISQLVKLNYVLVDFFCIKLDTEWLLALINACEIDMR